MPIRRLDRSKLLWVWRTWQSLPNKSPASIHHHRPRIMLPYDPTWLMPRAPFGTPVLKPFLNLRATSFIDRMRPEPVVFLLLAFSPQLSANTELVSFPEGLCLEFMRECILAFPHRAYYIVGSLPQDSHRKSRYAFEYGASGALSATLVFMASDASHPIRIRLDKESISYRNVCRECVTCCGACQNFQYP